MCFCHPQIIWTLTSVHPVTSLGQPLFPLRGVWIDCWIMGKGESRGSRNGLGVSWREREISFVNWICKESQRVIQTTTKNDRRGKNRWKRRKGELLIRSGFKQIDLKPPKLWKGELFKMPFICHARFVKSSKRKQRIINKNRLPFLNMDIKTVEKTHIFT